MRDTSLPICLRLYSHSTSSNFKVLLLIGFYSIKFTLTKFQCIFSVTLSQKSFLQAVSLYQIKSSDFSLFNGRAGIFNLLENLEYFADMD